MIGCIISCLLTFELICIREFAASRASGRSETITSETNYSIPNSNLAERTSVSDLVGPTEKAFKSQDATLTDRNQSSRSPYNQSPQTSSGDQDRKSPRLYLSRAIIATMSQHSQVKNNKRLNVTNSTHNYVDVETVTFKDEKPQKRVGTNPVTLLNDKPVSFQEKNAFLRLQWATLLPTRLQ
ncbi:unnamed protein product, partial [Iphiclides podalirius]